VRHSKRSQQPLAAFSRTADGGRAYSLTISIRRFEGCEAGSPFLDGYIEHDPSTGVLRCCAQWRYLGDSVLAGTHGRRPLVYREVATIVRTMDRDAVIARADEKPKNSTFNVLLRHVKRPFLGSRL
jgi:hypothetical protein